MVNIPPLGVPGLNSGEGGTGVGLVYNDETQIQKNHQKHLKHLKHLRHLRHLNEIVRNLSLLYNYPHFLVNILSRHTLGTS